MRCHPRELVDESAETAGNFGEALAIAATAPGAEQVGVIGGGQLYAVAIADPRLIEVHVTTVDVRVPADAHALALDRSWTAEEVIAPTRFNTEVSYRIDRHTRIR